MGQPPLRYLKTPLAMAAVAFAVRAAIIVLQRTYQVSPDFDHYAFGFETGRVARALASGHGFASPLHGDTGATAWLPPLYPLLLAGVFKIFGIYSTAAGLVTALMQSIFGALTCITIFHIGKKTFGDTVAVCAGWAWAFYYGSIHIDTTWVWDTSLATLLFSTVVLAGIAVVEKTSAAAWAGFGLLCGLTALTNASVLAVLPFLGLWIVMRASRRNAGWLPRASIAAAVFLATLTPWIARNYVTFGRFIPMRSNLGLELFLGTVEDKPGIGFYWMHPSMNAEELEKYRTMGEPAFMKEKMGVALQRINAEPGAFAVRVARCAINWWLGPWDYAYLNWQAGRAALGKKMLLNTFFTLLAFAGLALAIRRREGQPLLFGIVLLFFPLVYYAAHSAPRYRLPQDPFLMILAAYAVVSMVQKFRAKQSEPARAAVTVR